MKFNGKVVIVTGGANGIGKSIAAMFAEKGASVLIADIEEQSGEALASHLKQRGFEARFVKTDVRKPKDIEFLMKFAFETYGFLHCLVNNAGVSRWKSLFELSVEEWDDIINANLRSAFLCSREAARYMQKNEKGGAIVNIASTRALMSEADSEAYAASKGGILSLTHALAISLSPTRIRVNAISPGWIETRDYSALRQIDHEQHPARRVGKPEDIARLCLYLCDDDNDFITGANFVVDGGMTRKMIYEE